MEENLVNTEFNIQESLFKDFTREIFPDFEKIENEEKPIWRLSKNVLLVKSESQRTILVSGQGVKLSKKSERVVIKDNDEVFYEIPFFKLSNIDVQSRGVSLSSDLIEECCKRGITISFNSYNGKPYAIISSPYLNATVKTRREQLKAYNDLRGVIFSKKIINSKISNQINILKYFSKNLKNKNIEIYENIRNSCDNIEKIKIDIDNISGNNCDEIRKSLMSFEAMAGKIYWKMFSLLISKDFPGRIKRGARDPVNSLLNYGYGILYGIIWSSVLNAGLEPFAGFIHVDEPGRPSMILDVIESFRAPIIDRTVLSYINLGGKIELDCGLLTVSTRKAFSEKVLERIESYEYYNNKNYKIKSIIQIQTRNISSFFREGKEFEVFSFKW